MSETSSINQINYTGKGNLDPKMNAVETLPELYAAIPRKERRVGMCVTVLNADGDNEPHEFWLVGGTADANWVRKDTNNYIQGTDVEI